MYYPAQTSLIPAQIALVRFLGQNGLKAFFSNYPYWYLGTTPYRYLTGPILPLILSGVHKILPYFNLFEIMFGVIIVAWIVGGLGVYFLVGALKGMEKSTEGPRFAKASRGKHRTAILATFFYLFNPIIPFLFRFSDGLYLITFSGLPITLLIYLKLLRKWTRKRELLFLFCFCFLLLLDTKIFFPLLLGLFIIFVVESGWGKGEKKLKKSALILAVCFLLVSFWYTPGYWLTLLKGPSFGGKTLVLVISWLGKLLPTALALTLAVISGKFFKKKDKITSFCFYWLFVFGFLTLIRFLSDPDFWLDWSAYGIELQLGLAVLGGILLNRLLIRKQYQILNIKNQKHIVKSKNILYLICIFTIYFLIFTMIFKQYTVGTLQKDITQTVEYRIGEELAKMVKPPSADSTSLLQATSGQADERVFLSGTTAFWLNAFFDIPQIRGGVDQVSVDPNWRKAVWEIREGTQAEKSLQWLRELEISYLVVHTKESREFYHDYIQPEKFEALAALRKVYDKNGDRIYRIKK